MDRRAAAHRADLERIDLRTIKPSNKAALFKAGLLFAMAAVVAAPSFSFAAEEAAESPGSWLGTMFFGINFLLFAGILIYFAAFKKHIGFYSTSTGNGTLKDELSVYAGPKGSLKFPIDKPIPFGLIRKIVKFRAKENLERAEARGKKK